MGMLKKRFDVSLSEIKDFVSNLPIILGRGSKGRLLGLKAEYEQAGCVMELVECVEELNFLNVSSDNVREFAKDTKPREIFVYTCERIAEPLKALGFKYDKYYNYISKTDKIFTYRIYLQPRNGLTEVKVYVSVESDVLFNWRKQHNKINDDEWFDLKFVNLTKTNHSSKYSISSLSSRENAIEEINAIIKNFAFPFFERFKNLSQLIKDVEREESFLSHKMMEWEDIVNTIGIRHDFIKCFSEMYEHENQ